MYSYNTYDSIGIGVLIFMIIIGIGIYLAIYIPYLLNLQNLLKECNEKNRQGFSPSNVWLMFIPLFNIVYAFILYGKISEILSREFSYRGKTIQGDYGKSLGLTLAILPLTSLVPILGSLAGIANLVIFIIYWVKMAEFKSKLISLPKDGSGTISNNADLLD